MTNTKPLVSIVCFAYNHEKYIKDALEGFVMQQVNFPIEIVIHDDASTDNTQNIIREYELKYPNLLKPIYQKVNQASQETGRVTRIVMNAAKGKYIAMCEGDDYWTDPLKLQKQVDFLEANPEYILCFHNCDVIFEGNLNYAGYGVRQDLETREYTGFDLLKKWTIQSATVLFRNDYVLDEIKPKHKDLMNREIHTFLALLEKGKFYCINQKMSVYRRHAGGVTQIPKDLNTRIKFLKNYIAKNKVYNYKYDSVLRPKIASFSLNIAKEFFKKKSLKGFKYLYISLIHNPKSFLKFISKKI